MTIKAPSRRLFLLLPASVAGTIGALFLTTSSGVATQSAPRAPVSRVAIRANKRADLARIHRSDTVRISPVLRRDFRIRDRSARASASTAALPLGIAATVASNNFIDVNVGQAQFTSTPSGGIWFVPGSNGGCILEGASFVTVCAPTANVLAGALRSGNGDSTGKLDYVFGLVPNGTTTVTVTAADGSQQTVPVTNNVYEAKGHSLASVTFKSLSGAMVTKPL